MMRPSSRQPNPDFTVFTAETEPGVVSTRFWMQLLRYRPLILLGGLWLGLICAAAIAYSRLLSAGVPPTGQAPPLVAARPTLQGDRVQPGPVPAADPLVTPRPIPTAVEPTPGSGDEPLEVSTVAGQASFPLWSLGLLVVGCAAGCFVLSRQATATPKSRPARPPKAPQGSTRRQSQKSAPSRKGRPNRASGVAPSTAPKRLEPYAPERDQLGVSGRSPGVHPVSRAQVPEIASPPSTLQPLTVASPDQAPTNADVTVMPQEQAHPLDWTEDSIAHSLDIRQRRSLSSFL